MKICTFQKFEVKYIQEVREKLFSSSKHNNILMRDRLRRRIFCCSFIIDDFIKNIDDPDLNVQYVCCDFSSAYINETRRYCGCWYND